MADRTMLFDELLTEPNLRSKVYEVEDDGARRLVCVELTGRRGPDWFFARRWVSVAGSRRLLFRELDRCERAGFRFAVASGPAPTPAPPPMGEQDHRYQRAGTFYEQLEDDEKSIYAELFPAEIRLLSRGYDWDHEAVWRDGVRLERDAHGRILERVDGVLWEWVRVDEEFTWRRYPLERIRNVTVTAGT